VFLNILKLFALCLIYYVKKTSSLIQSSKTGEKSQKQANSIDIAQASTIKVLIYPVFLYTIVVSSIVYFRMGV